MSDEKHLNDASSTPRPDTAEQRSERLVRPSVRAIDEMLGLSLGVLDDGFVRVIDYLGDDAAVVQAARVSYGAGTKKLQEDRALLRYLMRHSHTTPFEMCEIKLHIRAPMDLWRQWIRHRTANVNEYSTRYSIAIDAAEQTAADAWRAQATENRQGSVGNLSREIGLRLSAEEADLQRQSREVYERRLSVGVAREQARKDLPLSTYTEAYWKIDLHNLLNFLHLRMDSHAQLEIRSYATVIGERILARWVPAVWEAFLDYRLHGVRLSRYEADIIKALIAGSPDTAIEIATAKGMLRRKDDNELASNRERRELEVKLLSFGLTPPWR